MAIFLSYTDIRSSPSVLLKFKADWTQDMIASEVISICMGEEKVKNVETDLSNNNPEIIVSWYHKPTGDICEIGGVKNLTWKIADHTILTIAYENQTTTKEQIDELIKWTENQDEFN